MQRKERMQRLGVVLLFVGTAALGIMIGVFIFLTNPELAPGPDEQATATPEPVVLATPLPDWRLTFEYRLSGNQLNLGSHTYQLQVSCPDSGTGTWENGLEVSSSAPLRDDRVYLRTRGVYDAITGGRLVNSIHPNQTVGAAITLSYPTQQQASAAREVCQAFLRVDGGRQSEMQPRVPTQGG